MDNLMISESLLAPAFDNEINIKDETVQGEKEKDTDKQNTTEDNSEDEEKPRLSYIALISQAIQSNPEKRLLLCDIYDWISSKHPQFQPDDRSWRNSVRHNLSLNECFVKAGRADNGKGHYWAIHPANVDDFAKGDYHRRRARRRVRMSSSQSSRTCSSIHCDKQNTNHICGGYVAMMTTVAPATVLASMYGEHVIYTPQERAAMQKSRWHCQADNKNTISKPYYYQMLCQNQEYEFQTINNNIYASQQSSLQLPSCQLEGHNQNNSLENLELIAKAWSQSVMPSSENMCVTSAFQSAS